MNRRQVFKGLAGAVALALVPFTFTKAKPALRHVRYIGGPLDGQTYTLAPHTKLGDTLLVPRFEKMSAWNLGRYTYEDRAGFHSPNSYTYILHTITSQYNDRPWTTEWVWIHNP